MEEKRYNPKLSTAEVNSYWRNIEGFTERAWMQLSENKRVEIAWANMLEKERLASEALRKARDHREGNS